MIPNASEMLRRRLTARTLIRLACVALLLIAIVPFVSWLMEGIRDDDFFNLYYYTDRIVLTGVFVVLPVVVWLLQGILVRWLVPMPRGVRCPGCGQDTTGLVEQRCPECALPLTAEFLDPARPPEVHLDGPALALKRRETAAIVFRIIGIPFALVMLIYWLALAAAVVISLVDPHESIFIGVSDVVTTFVWTLGLTLTAALLCLRPRWLAAFAVPIPRPPASSPIAPNPPPAPPASTGNP
ncbi:MAG: hypothetical protein ACF8Q5_02585 [Phycisphaerales bacterium JB040]